MCRYFKRGMPLAWQEKLASSGVTHDTSSMMLYFSRIEKYERTTNSATGLKVAPRSLVVNETKRDKDMGPGAVHSRTSEQTLRSHR